jgi:Tfp pilus assembly protein PilO
MVIIGLVLFVAAAVFGVDLTVKNRFATRGLHVFGESLGISGSAHIYVLGAITGAALILGLALLLAGLRHKGSRAVERHQERKVMTSRTSELEALRAENAELRSRLDVLERRTPVVATADDTGSDLGATSSNRVAEEEVREDNQV